MTEILDVLTKYKGSGLLLFVYLAALVYLLIREKDRTVRALFVYLPLTVLILFMLPPVYALYSRIETDTYYRLLWLIPMGMSILYAGLKLAGRHTRIAIAVLCAVFILCGTYTYKNINISKAANRLHLPYQTVDVCDFLLRDSGGKQIKAAMPAELVQTVRQYTSKINMPFGREMTVPRWDYWNEVYDVMEKPDTVDVQKLAAAARHTKCSYIVLSSVKKRNGDLTDYGMEYLGLVDGFDIYRFTQTEQ